MLIVNLQLEFGRLRNQEPLKRIACSGALQKITTLVSLAASELAGKRARALRHPSMDSG